jgi:hypothetical protein
MTNTDKGMFYFDILEGFFRNKIKYLIVGGVAINLYGVPRMTQDLDIIISMEPDNIRQMNQTLHKLGYVPRLPVEADDLADPQKVKSWIEERNLTAFSYYHQDEIYKVIDIILNHPLSFGEAFAKKIIRQASGIEVYLASVADIIKMKQGTGRDQDESDIKMLRDKNIRLENENG